VEGDAEMSELSLTMHGPTRVYDAVVAAEVVSYPTPVEVRQFSLRMNTAVPVEVPPGDYSVRVMLPSGRTLTRHVNLSAQGSALQLSTRHSAHEWLGWPAFVGDYPPKQEYEQEVPPVTEPTIWHRLWRRSGRSWSVEPWPDSWVDSDDRAWNYGFASRAYWERIIEVGGKDVPWRYTLLPPTSHVNVTIHPKGGDGIHERGARITVGCSNEQGPEGLLRYLSSGLLEAAGPIADDLLNSPGGVWVAPESVMAPAAIGYYLLEVQDWPRLSSVISRLTKQAPSLSDTAVLQGLYALQAPNSKALSEASDWLVEATTRGVPAFTVGLVKLRDGLERLRHSKPRAKVRQARIDRALDMITPYAEASDWTKPYTTFYGLAPDRPSLASATGVPSIWEGIEFLAEWEGIELLAGDQQTPGAPFPPAGPPLRRRATVRIIRDGVKWAIEEMDSTIPRETFRSKSAAVRKAEELGASLPLRVLIDPSATSPAEWRLLGPPDQRP
jgi:hypothetical protein